MQLLDLTIGTRHFYLPADTDLAELEHQVENAARTGGAMIQIPGAREPSTSALITPSIPVFIERIDTPEDSHEDDGDLRSVLDFDLSSTFSDWDN